MEPAFALRVGNYIIRSCEEADLQQVIRINMVTLPEHYSDFFFWELLHDSPETFFVAELDREIVGYIMPRIEHGFANLKHFGFAKKGHIVSVSVLEAHRKMGLGRVLIQEAIKGMKKRGCTEVYLEVRVSNQGAISLYHKLNFIITSTCPGYYKDGEAAYVMAKAI